MIQEKNIKDILVNQQVVDDMFIVNVKVAAGNKITVLIDSPDGVSIDNCISITRLIESQLDRDTEDFELQVSSPGLGQPFRVFQQYEKNIDRDIEVLKNDGKKLKGKLTEVTSEYITIEYNEKRKIEGTKKKQNIINQLKINFTEIKQAKSVISFK